MTEPLRFADDVDPALARLLRAGQAEAPPAHALRKTLAGLGAATTVLGASQVAGAAVQVGKLGVWSLAKWVGAGVLSGVVTIGGVELVQHGIEVSQRDSAAETASVAPAPKPAGGAAEQRRGELPSEPPALAPSPIEHSNNPAPLAGPAEPKPSGLVRPASSPRLERDVLEVDSTMALEIALIDEARRALQAGRATATLEALRRHRAEVKRQRLAPEARYLEMEALFVAGNRSAAQAAARALLATYSKGPHAERARAILGEPTGDHKP